MKSYLLKELEEGFPNFSFVNMSSLDREALREYFLTNIVTKKDIFESLIDAYMEKHSPEELENILHNPIIVESNTLQPLLEEIREANLEAIVFETEQLALELHIAHRLIFLVD